MVHFLLPLLLCVMRGPFAAPAAATAMPANSGEGFEIDSNNDGSLINLAHGTIRGRVTPQWREFKGIPYAAPPLGEE